MHDIKDIRKNPEKYRESQRVRGLDPGVIDILLRKDIEVRAYKTIDQELQSKLNKLTDEYGKRKREGATETELVYIQLDMEMAKIDAGLTKSDLRVKYMEEELYDLLGGRKVFEEICEEIEKGGVGA